MQDELDRRSASAGLLCLDLEADLLVELPEVSAQLPRHGNDHFVAMQPSCPKPFEAVVQTILSPPCDRFDFPAPSGLSLG